MVEDWLAQSSLYVEGRAEGVFRGALQQARGMCAALVRKYHTGIADRALPAIAACSNLERLEEWALATPELRDAEFLRLLGVSPSPRTNRRGPMPPRRR